MELMLVFILIFSFSMLFFSFICILIFIDNYDRLWIDPKPKKKYSISAIIPAYNEQKSIEKTVNGIYMQDYPKELFEIIVVNDGSTDNTKKICQKLQKQGIIKLINKKNGGKANAVNLGIKNAKNELIYIMDADSFPEKNSFKSMIGYFNDPKVAAVSSSMKVNSKKNFFEKMQWIEYSLSILFRKIQSLFNSMYVTPGPGSIYRKSVINEVGGFNEETLTEDMEIAFNIQNKGYAIENSMNSIVYTNTPIFLKQLLKQRKRWYSGYFDDSSKYKHLLFNPKKGVLSALLSFNIVSVLSLIALFFYSGAKFAVNSKNSLILFKASEFAINIPSIKGFQILYGINFDLIIFALISALSALMVYMSLKSCNEKTDIKKNFPLYICYFFIYTLFLTVFWLTGFFHNFFLRKKGEGWHG
ncbi:MAG: glycosyltransferase [Candidatus Nanoarchaeia archaeon]|nr:glycosyltransferase [Candidatus Nanoarchaeia archaeon]